MTFYLITFGNKKKKNDVKKMSPANTIKPAYQAPTQFVSLGLMFNLSFLKINTLNL